MAINSQFQSVGSQGLTEEGPILKREKSSPLHFWLVCWVYWILSALSGMKGLHKIAFGETECIMYVSVRQTDRNRGSTLALLAVCDALDSTPHSLFPQLPKWPQSCHWDWCTGADKEHLSATYRATSGLPTMLQCSVLRGKRKETKQHRQYAE